MNKCLNCGVIFQHPKKLEVPDHTGHIDLIIDVCPMCNSNNIQPTNSSVHIVLDAADTRHLERMKDLYIKVCSEQKQATTNIDLIRHYSALIQYAEDFHKKIIINNIYGGRIKS